MWDSFTLAVQADAYRIYLGGPPGVGKSHAAQEVSRDHLAKYKKETDPYQATLNEDLTVQELLGHYVPAEGDHGGQVFKYHYGPVAAAMRDGIPLIINEISRASGAVQDMLLGVLDDPAIASVTLPNGDRLKPAAGFRVIATANTDVTELGEALQDRFDAAIFVTEPHPELVKSLDALKAGLGQYVKNSYKDPDRAISPRRVLSLLNFIAKGVTLEQAAKIIFKERAGDFIVTTRAAGVFA